MTLCPSPPSATFTATPMDWEKVGKELEIHFQPIVNLHTGQAIGMEALYEGTEKFGFADFDQLAAQAQTQDQFSALENNLRLRALESYTALRPTEDFKLFYNLNPLLQPDPKSLLNHFIPLQHNLCMEVSEWPPTEAYEELIHALQDKGFNLALDHFGPKSANLNHFMTPGLHFVKLDESWIKAITQEGIQRTMVTKLVEAAHLIGLATIAMGVARIEQFYSAKNAGIDYLQGSLIQEPTAQPEDLLEHYSRVEEFNQRDRRRKSRSGNNNLIRLIEVIEPIVISSDMEQVMERFKNNNHLTFFPVVSDLNEPLGILRELDLKKYIYSRYGRELLLNRNIGSNLLSFVSRCPIATPQMSGEDILKLFSHFNGAEGVIMTTNMKYTGFLTAQNLLKMIHEKNLITARDQNPLTQLPGNNRIREWISKAMSKKEESFSLVYFDFDNFKPFNDTYGFRDGDRAILIFADILRKNLDDAQNFVGHIGGDDFFVAFPGTDFELTLEQTQKLRHQFSFEVASLYNPTDREKGYIQAKSRQGELTKFPLLSVSASILQVKTKNDSIRQEELSSVIASLKKEAKTAELGIAAASFLKLKSP